jgi:hypothetical protein
MGHIVWVSKNGEMMGIQCPASHIKESPVDSYGFKRSPSKSNKNSVFLVKIEA